LATIVNCDIPARSPRNHLPGSQPERIERRTPFQSGNAPG
jgi:hypothetical protein